MKKVFTLFTILVGLISCGQNGCIEVPVKSISLSDTELKLTIGQQKLLEVIITPEDATEQNILWSSSAESVADVDKNGIVKAVAKGTAIITAASESSGKKAHCEVTVVSGESGDEGEYRTSPATVSLEMIGAKTASFKGHIDVNSADLSFCKITLYYSDAETFNIFDAKSIYTTTFDANQNFELAMNGLKSETNYKYCVLAEVRGEKYYSEISSFTTEKLAISISVQHYDVDYDMAKVSGNLTITSAEFFTKKVSLYYSATTSTIESLKSNGIEIVLDLRSNGDFSIELPNLKDENIYSYVVICTIDGEEFVSDIKSFTTLSEPEIVDLGLSVKWRSRNIGADKSYECGDYYAWGELEAKNDYSWATYRYCNGSYNTLTKYCTMPSSGTYDGKNVLESSDDVAHEKLGGSWRMPTLDEWGELGNKNNCSWTWTSDYNGTSVSGYIVKSKKIGYTDKRIFLPTAGRYDHKELKSTDVVGYYWSSVLRYDEPRYALIFMFESTYVNWGNGQSRFEGLPIRSVCE